MKKLTVLFSVLILALFVGQNLVLADGSTDKPAKKPCKVNFKPGNKKHSEAVVTPAK